MVGLVQEEAVPLPLFVIAHAEMGTKLAQKYVTTLQMMALDAYQDVQEWLLNGPVLTRMQEIPHACQFVETEESFYQKPVMTAQLTI